MAHGRPRKDKQTFIEQDMEPFKSDAIEDAYNRRQSALEKKRAHMEEQRSAEADLVKLFKEADIDEYKIGGRRLFIEHGSDAVKIKKIPVQQTANA
jgi:hypothetical protein